MVFCVNSTERALNNSSATYDYLPAKIGKQASFYKALDSFLYNESFNTGVFNNKLKWVIIMTVLKL